MTDMVKLHYFQGDILTKNKMSRIIVIQFIGDESQNITMYAIL